jgi:Ni,Fe-hydrogenase III small subunit
MILPIIINNIFMGPLHLQPEELLKVAYLRSPKYKVVVGVRTCLSQIIRSKDYCDQLDWRRSIVTTRFLRKSIN